MVTALLLAAIGSLIGIAIGAYAHGIVMTLVRLWARYHSLGFPSETRERAYSETLLFFVEQDEDLRKKNYPPAQRAVHLFANLVRSFVQVVSLRDEYTLNSPSSAAIGIHFIDRAGSIAGSFIFASLVAAFLPSYLIGAPFAALVQREPTALRWGVKLIIVAIALGAMVLMVPYLQLDLPYMAISAYVSLSIAFYTITEVPYGLNLRG